MKPRPQNTSAFQLFQAHFDQILNPEHPLMCLAGWIDGSGFDVAFDESVVERWVENPYWQYFCGFTHLQHQAPIDPSSMSRWRKRVGAQRLELLLNETVELAVRAKQLPKRDLKQVTIDTTVQEKNITYPTDSKLLYTAIRKLGQAARERGIGLRQSYVRVGKRAAVKASR